MDGIGKSLANDLASKELCKVYGEHVNTAQKQRNVLWELVIAALRSKLPFAKVKDLLARALEQFIAAVVPSEYCPKLLDHATTL